MLKFLFRICGAVIYRMLRAYLEYGNDAGVMVKLGIAPDDDIGAADPEEDVYAFGFTLAGGTR